MRTLFIVEDEEIEREALIKLIRERYAGEIRIVGFAEDGENAVERISTLRPQIILLDIHIQGFSGLEVARRLRGDGIESAIIIITAYSRFDYAREAIQLNAVDYIVKPYSIKTLDSVLTRVIESIDDPAIADADGTTPVDRARLFIDEQYARELTLDMIADRAGMSKYHLSRSFHSEVGMGIKEYQIRCRIRHAEGLLRDGLTVAEAGCAVGFTDPNYFSRIVKKYTGRSPGSMKKRN